jgi:hypothetical protein
MLSNWKDGPRGLDCRHRDRGELDHRGGGGPPRAVRLVEHEAVLARATGSVGRLDGLMAAAMSNGELQAFNREFRRRRIEAAARGQPFATYTLALAKL